MLRRCGKADTHEVHEAANTHSQSAADATQRNFLTEQAFHSHTLFFVYHSMGGVYDKLATTVLALMILLASVNMAIFLELLEPTLRTPVSHAHGHLLPPLLSVRNAGYS
jgi:hypothetical protein